MSRPDPAAGIAGLCFLACALLLVLAFAFQQWRIYAPIAREMILATLTPQFGAGMVFMLLLVFVGALIFAHGDRA